MVFVVYLLLVVGGGYGVVGFGWVLFVVVLDVFCLVC